MFSKTAFSLAIRGARAQTIRAVGKPTPLQFMGSQRPQLKLSNSLSAYRSMSCYNTKRPLARLPTQATKSKREFRRNLSVVRLCTATGRNLIRFLAVAFAIPVGYLIGFFIYDSTTYSEGPLQINVNIDPNALNLKKGGPKNLPIAEHFIDDDELKQTDDSKPRVLILGSGWGAVALLRTMDTTKYNVTIVSPTNHFLFTPLLPCAAVGTLSLDTLVEPIRDLCRKRNARFIEGSAHDISLEDRLVEVRTQDQNDGDVRFYVPYDKVVIATGAKSNTHGVPGLENCFFFKDARDAANLRMAIARNLEVAALPSTSEEERKRLLSFVICGGGPTGVELASEIFDLLKEDVPKKFPNQLINHASVHVIQSRSAILNTYDAQISQYAMKQFMKDGIDLLTDSRVVEVKPDAVVFNQMKHGEKKQFEVPYGICLWTTGIGITRFTKSVMSQLTNQQHNSRALETDTFLRVLGAPSGEVYAIGDCSTVKTALVEDLELLLHRQAKDANLDTAYMRVGDVENFLLEGAKREPQARQHLLTIKDKILRRHNLTETISMAYVAELLKEADRKVLTLPATAQRANQQGIYLGKKLNALQNADTEIKTAEAEEAIYPPFKYKNLGSLAYISNAAVFDTQDAVGFNFFGGIYAMYLWRGVYLSQTVSMRARTHMTFDWLYRGLFGRQIYSYDRTK